MICPFMVPRTFGGIEDRSVWLNKGHERQRICEMKQIWKCLAIKSLNQSRIFCNSVAEKPPVSKVLRKLCVASELKPHNSLQYQHFMLCNKNTLTLLPGPDTLPVVTLYTRLQSLYQISDFSTLPLSILICPKDSLDTYRMHSGHASVAGTRGAYLGLCGRRYGLE